MNTDYHISNLIDPKGLFTGLIIILIGFIGTLFRNQIFSLFKKRECKIKISPIINTATVTIMKGGKKEPFMDFQICFNSESDLELIDAILIQNGNIIHNEERAIKIYGGKSNNHFQFSTKLITFKNKGKLLLKIRVLDAIGNCADVKQEMQLIHATNSDPHDINQGRWDIHPIGIFKIEFAKNKKF